MALAILLGGCASSQPAGEQAATSPRLDRFRHAGSPVMVVTTRPPGVGEPGAPVEPELGTETRDEIEWLASILGNSANDARTRAGSAARLIYIGHPLAIEPLEAALRSGDADLVVAVVDALTEFGRPLPELLDPMVIALMSAPGWVIDPLAQAISRFGDKGFAAVRTLASDRSLSSAGRVGPIRALGAFRSRAAATELMAMLDPSRGEGEEIVTAVCAALRRGTGLPYTDDPAVWRAWWTEARRQPAEEWLTNLVQHLAEQLAAAEQQVRREHESSGALERQIADVHREFFPLLAVEEQTRRLPGLLEHRLPSLRTFAVDRIARLLRDSVRIPEELQLKLAERLNDELPAIRLQAARLLDQLNMDSTGERVARRLEIEQSPEVVGTFLDILMKRPAASALPTIARWLNDPVHGGRAAGVAWEITGATSLDAPRREALRAAVLASGRWRESPPHARLLGAVGDESDLREVERLFDSRDSAMRRAVAEAFYRRNLWRPLVERAGDDAVYPFALRSLARAPVDVSAARRAVALKPANDAGRAIWTETIVKIAGKLPASALIEVDELLSAAAEAPPQLRIDVLERVRAAPAGEIDTPLRAELLTRLAQLYLALEQPLTAHETMELLNGEQLDAAARNTRFEAAALSGYYDLAAQIKPAPEPWLALLAHVAGRNASVAAPLHEEIGRRFAPQLDGELKTQFERIGERLRERADAGPGQAQ